MDTGIEIERITPVHFFKDNYPKYVGVKSIVLNHLDHISSIYEVPGSRLFHTVVYYCMNVSYDYDNDDSIGNLVISYLCRRWLVLDEEVAY